MALETRTERHARCDVCGQREVIPSHLSLPPAGASAHVCRRCLQSAGVTVNRLLAVFAEQAGGYPG